MARLRQRAHVATALTVVALSVLTTATLLAQGTARQRPDRGTLPAIGPAPTLDLPPIQKRALSNGLPVWIIETHEVPLVQVNLLVQAGSGDDPDGKFGVASFTAAMLDEGAGTRSSLDIADAVEFIGASLSSTSSFDASAVRLNVPVARLRDALPVMADVALRPTFPAMDLNRVREERVTALLQGRDDPEQIAPLAFARAVFGARHRYGTAAIGTEATLKAFTADDLRRFHAALYQPANAALVVVGDVRAAEVLPQLEQQFGGWKNTTPVRRAAVPVAAQLTGRQIVIVDKPDAAQSQIRIGGVGVSRATPDFFTLEVLNTILGGSFSSRLNQNLREEHQYAYGASSRFDMRLSPGSFASGAAVQTDKTPEAVREFFNELERIQTPVDADELTRAKNYVAFGLPGEFETSANLAVRMEETIIYKLPDDYFEQYVSNIQKVSADDVRKAAATYIQPVNFVVVIVGDSKVIEPGVRALKLAPVKVISVDQAIGGGVP